MTRPEANQIGFSAQSLVRSELIGKEVESEVSILGIAIAIFGLYSRLIRQLHLHEGIGDIIVLIAVGPESIRFKVREPNAQGEAVIDA